MFEVVLSSGNILLIGSVILLVAIFAAKSSSRFGTPTLLLFLIIGMLFGSDGLGIVFDNPMTAQFIGMLALSVILFSGGMDTKYSEIRPVIKEGVVLATLGVLLTAVITGAFIYLLSIWFNMGLTIFESLLLASVMSSTDSASVFAILRSKKKGLSQNLRPLLELESGSNDPMAYILTIILIQVVTGGEADVWHAAFTFVIQMTIGFAAGFMLGKAAVYIINKINIGNKSLYAVMLLAMVYLIFSLTDLVGGNGYLAVYIAGLVVGNNKIVFQKSLTNFFDGYTWLFQIVMFISLGLLVNPHELLDVMEPGLLIAVFMILFARPISVFLCMLPFKNVDFKGRLYVSWVGLRGAVPIIFATYILAGGVEHAGMMFNTVFFITIISLLVQGTTVSSMANLLGLSTKLKEDSFNIDIPDEISAQLVEKSVTEQWLKYGSQLKDLPFDDKTLVMMLRRGDDYIVPKGDTQIMAGDQILCLIGDDKNMPEDYSASKEKLKRKRNIFAVLRDRLMHKSDENSGEISRPLFPVNEEKELIESVKPYETHENLDDGGADSGFYDITENHADVSLNINNGCVDPRFNEDLMDDGVEDIVGKKPQSVVK